MFLVLGVFMCLCTYYVLGGSEKKMMCVCLFSCVDDERERERESEGRIDLNASGVMLMGGGPCHPHPPPFPGLQTLRINKFGLPAMTFERRTAKNGTGKISRNLIFTHFCHCMMKN